MTLSLKEFDIDVWDPPYLSDRIRIKIGYDVAVNTARMLDWRGLESRYNTVKNRTDVTSKKFWDIMRDLSGTSDVEEVVFVGDEDTCIVYKPGRSTYATEPTVGYLSQVMTRSREFKLVKPEDGGSEVFRLYNLGTKYIVSLSKHKVAFEKAVIDRVNTYVDEIAKQGPYCRYVDPFLLVVENEGRQYPIHVDRDCNAKMLDTSLVMVTKPKEVA